MIRLAVIGTGGMANAHANSFKPIRGVKLVGACDVDADRAAEYAERHGIPSDGVFTDYEELLDTLDIDAVTNVTPDAMHCPISLACIARGKHILCEKPLATNYADAKKMAAAAGRKGVIHMVNLSYRNAPAIHRAADMVAAGRIGRVMHVKASYLQSWLSSKYWGDWRTGTNWLWRLSEKHGSKGVLGDVGVHILDFATYPAGSIKTVHCELKTFKKAPRNRIGEYRLDANDSAMITAELDNGALAAIDTTRWASGHMNTLRLEIFGDAGAIRIDLDKSYDQLEACMGRDLDKARWKTLKCRKTPNIYRRFVRSIQSGENDQPDFDRGAHIQKVMDACFESDRTDKTIRV